MTKPYGILAATMLAVGGMTLIGCHNNPDNNPNNNPSASMGGVGGGGSTDSYGTGADARLRSTGNIGVDSGQAPSNAGTPQPAVTAGERTPNNQPPQTPSGPGDSATGTSNGTNAPGNGSVHGNTTGNSTTGNESGARTDAVPTRNTSQTTNGNNNAGAAVGGNSGNGTTNNGRPIPGPNSGQ